MADSVYTVAQVNAYIKNMFMQDYLLSAVAVKGEISNCKYHSSGHIYFTLKDKQSVISCIMFAGNRRGLSFSLQDGIQVVVYGRVDTYERDGKYQLYASKITKDGLGELYEHFLKLKEELEEQGLFAAEYKKSIPRYCKRLGVVTAPTGAAIRDIISVAKNRDPYIQIILYPAIVQGEQAPESIAKGIKALESYGVDTMIVGRGGGSLEDLWAFNEEIVAQAIFDCSVPVISAVGHETDTTIADFVADKRAETPTAAAQMAVEDMTGAINRLNDYSLALKRNIYRKTDLTRANLKNFEANLKRLSPESKIAERRFFVMQWSERLAGEMRHIIEDKRNSLALKAGELQGISPLDKLSQGYSFTENESGSCINDVKKVKIGDKITVHLKNGRLKCSVDKTIGNIDMM